LGTGGKIAIGCGIAALVGVIVVVVALGAGAFWVKGKAETIAAEQKQITDLQAQANQNDFTAPADGVISEPRLLKFIEVRKRVYDVYVKNEAALKAMADNKEGQASLGDVRKAFALMNEIRLAQARAQVAEGMSDAEYAFLVQQVYKSSWAAGVADATGGQSVSEAVGQAYDRAAEQMEKAAGTVTGGDEAAREALEKGARNMEQQSGDVREAAESMDVPAANVELFRKHEAEIKKYAMTGLEWIGL
jgi:hypothetical protein